MTVSVFRGRHTSNLDSVAPTTPGPDAFRCGILVAGSTKTVNRVAIDTFDLTSTPDEGPPMPATANITAADILGNVTAVLGSGWQFGIVRLADDHGALYDYLNATATLYAAGLAWRAPVAAALPAADVDTPPAQLAYNCPTSLGDQTLAANVLAFVLDALASRAGQLRLRWQMISSVSASAHMTCKASPLTASDVVRLSVTWNEQSPAPIDHPAGVTLPGAAPSPAAAPGRAGAPSPPARPPQPKGARLWLPAAPHFAP